MISGSVNSLRADDVDMNDRKNGRISLQELELGWKLVRDHMEEHGIDALVAQSARDFTGGYVKWFTDVPAGYPRTVVFHASDLMTIVEHGPAGRRRSLAGDDSENPGVGEIITTCAFPSVDFTLNYDAAAVSDVLSPRGYRRIALVGAGTTPHGFIAHLERTLSGKVAMTDETDFVDRAKAVKSPEEIGLIRKNAAMQDVLFSKVLSHIQ